jgi:hypothetical protein
MLNNLIRKSVICGIILLFLGVSFSSSINGTLNDESFNAVPTNSPLNDYVLAYWKFDEGSGTILEDSSGHDYDGTINGANWVTGHSGYALDFDGANDYVNLGPYSEQLGMNKTDDFIYTLWFKSTSDDAGYIYCNAGAGHVPELLIKLLENGSLEFRIWTNVCGILVISDNPFNDNNWHHLKIIFNGLGSDPTATMYVDDDFEGNHTIYLCPMQPDEFKYAKIGRRGLEDEGYFDGLIDEFKIIKYPGGNKQKAPIIDGPTVGVPDVEYDFTFTIDDPEGDDDIWIKVDWDDGDVTDWLGPYQNGETVELSHIWDEDDRYDVKAKSKDFWDDSHWSSPPYVVKIGNQPPESPTIDGPRYGDPQEQLTYTFVAGDEEEDNVKYFIEWDDGTTGESGYVASNTPVQLSHSWEMEGEYNITATAIDIHGKPGDPSSALHIRIGDKQPNIPDIYGAYRGNPGTVYEYGFMSTDLDNDNLLYDIDWGDGDIETDIGPFPSGEIFPRSHSWSDTGTYIVKSRVKDEFDYYSDWATHEISVPRNKGFNLNLLELLFERFQRNFLAFRNLLGLLNIELLGNFEL